MAMLCCIKVLQRFYFFVFIFIIIIFLILVLFQHVCEAKEYSILVSGSSRAGGTLRSAFQQVGRPSSEDTRQVMSEKFVIDFSPCLVIGLI